MVKRSFKDSLRRMFLLHTLVPISILFVLFLLFMMINSKLLLVNQTSNAGKKIESAMENVYASYIKEMHEAAQQGVFISFAESGRGGPELFERFYTFNSRQ
ncbi:hypothetical protein [Paenibacillus sp. PL2-23]|uniref:hypothetical protein n=1 Tax=Paenibacillus sp. PL2-23 TaxID=2100729 RepID=UPI0030FA81DD